MTNEPRFAPWSPSARESVPFGIRVAACWSGYLLVIAAGVALVFWGLAALGLVTVSMVTGIMVAALLQPLVAWFMRHGLSRGLAAVASFLVGFGAVALLVWFVVAQIMGSRADFQRQLNGAERSTRHWLITGPFHVNAGTASEYTTNLSSTISAHSGAIATAASSQVGAVTGAVSGFVVTLFVVLFLLADDGSMFAWCVRLLPRGAHGYAKLAGAAGWRTLVVYMRSLVLLAILNAVAMLPVMLVAGVPLAIPLTVLLFLGSLIPLVGALAAGAVLFVIALIAKGFVTAIIVVIALVVIIQLFGNLLNPLILGKFVDVHPVVILLGVTGGTILDGAFGAFTAVPLIAVVNNMVKVMRAHYLERHPDQQVEAAPDSAEDLSETELEGSTKESL